MGKTNLRQLVRTHGSWKTGLEHDWSKFEHFENLNFCNSESILGIFNGF